jgi:hypothetical protein
MSESKIVAFDPGGTTGWAMLSQDWSLTHGIFTEKDHHLALWKFLLINMPDIVVCERFVYQNREATPTLELISRDYIGVITLWCQLYGKHLEMQTVSDAKSQWPDKKLILLKNQGQNMPKIVHAKDAMRHLMLYLVKQQAYYFLRMTMPGKD